jgi:hypothetical protein
MSTAVLKQIADLERMSLAELRIRWREFFDTEPPGYSKQMLCKRIAYRIQELAFGGLSESTKAKLREHLPPGERVGDGGQVRPLASRQRDDGKLAPGTRLVRIWRDRRLEVTVLDDGFEFEGRRYRSLSAIAREATSARWNGWLFFNLRGRAKGRR